MRQQKDATGFSCLSSQDGVKCIEFAHTVQISDEIIALICRILMTWRTATSMARIS
jgi:hypothetical protein